MAQIQWGVPRTRTVETGVDQGVVYVEGASSGVPWRGLTRVERSNPEADLEPVYFEGYMTNLMRLNSPTTFQLETLSVPKEFMPCLGKVALAPGFYADNQPLKSFGFSYRTLVANDTEGLAFGYKIHIIFQAYASERAVVRQTLAQNPTVVTRTYEIKTIPILIEGYKPISYISVSSESVSPQGLNELEDVLYGTDSTEPTLPTVAEIVEIIS
jgi:hypothetical protein